MVKANGKTYQGNNIMMVNGKVYIDGKLQEGDSESKTVNIVVDAPLESLKVDCCDSIVVNGNVGLVESENGDIEINGDVSGDVSTENGDIDISGHVTGDVSTENGDVKFRK